jgi:hypothetical protein
VCRAIHHAVETSPQRALQVQRASLAGRAEPVLTGPIRVELGAGQSVRTQLGVRAEIVFFPHSIRGPHQALADLAVSGLCPGQLYFAVRFSCFKLGKGRRLAMTLNMV